MSQKLVFLKESKIGLLVEAIYSSKTLFLRGTKELLSEKAASGT
jgi:hypothetical protein